MAMLALARRAAATGRRLANQVEREQFLVLAAAAKLLRRVVARPVEHPPGQDVPAEETVVRRHTRKSLRIARQHLVADGSQTLAEHPADVGVLPAPLDDLGGAMLVNVADGQLVKV